MKTGIISISLAVILVLIPCLPAIAQDNDAETITITMTGAETRVEITLDKENWALGEVTADTEYKTVPEPTWCTITNAGNVNVDLGINGENAKFSDVILWYLSEDATNDGIDGDPERPEYVLWYHVAYGEESEYVLITHEPTPMKKGGEDIILEVDSTKQFGLRLLTPVSFPSEYIGKEMTTHITISAVQA